MPMNPRLLRPSSTFTPRSISGLALWLDAADSSTLYTTDAGPVTAVSAPTEISGCVGWWDASDASSITQSGGLVSEWNDKSGLGNHATASGTARPTLTASGLNGLSVMTFDGTANSMAVAANAAFNTNELTYFIVFRATSDANKGVYTKISPSAGTNGFAIATRATSPFVWLLAKNSSQPQVLAVSGVSPTTQARIYSVTSSSTASGFLDGLSAASASSTADHSLNQTVRIGSREGSEFFGGYIAEIIHFNAALSPANRARCEAYLAAKWGISGVHAPATATNDPVGAWLDKSGNGRHMLQPSSSPRPVRSTQNNRPSLSFNGTNSTLTGSYSNADVAGAGGAAYFAAFRPASDDTYSVMNPNGDGGHRDRFSNGQAFPAVFRNTRLNNVLTNMMPVASAGLLSHVVAAGVSHQIRLDGAIRHTAADDFAAWRARGGGLNGYKIGDSGQGDFLSGTIGEILIYGRALSATEVVRIERYLASKWGITLAPQVSNADAQDWVNRVYANGGTVSASTASAVNQFCVDIENAGIRDRFYRLNLFCGNSDANLAAVRTPLFRGQSLAGTQYGNATDTNVNFVAGDYAETGASGGLLGNGSTKLLRTGLATNALTVGDRHLSAYEVVRSGATFDYFLGSDVAGVQQFILGYASPANVVRFGYGAFAANVISSATTTGGHWLGVSPTTASGIIYKNGVADGNNTTTAATPPSYEMYAFANNRDNAATDFYGGRLGGYSIGAAFTAAQALAYYNAMQAFQTALGRQV